MTDEVPVLKFVFDWYIDTNITDEQAERVLQPVLLMIKEGRFNRSNDKGNQSRDMEGLDM